MGRCGGKSEGEGPSPWSERAINGVATPYPWNDWLYWGVWSAREVGEYKGGSCQFGQTLPKEPGAERERESECEATGR